MMTRVSVIGLRSMVLAVLALGAADAAAQPPVQSFADLQPTLKVGQSVLVTDDKGITTQGRVVSIVGNQLEISEPRFSRKNNHLFTEVSVRRIEDADGSWNGELIGGAIGLLAGWAMVSNPPKNHDSEGGPVLGAGAVAAGVAMGKWIDNKIHRLLYVSPRRAGISFAPSLSPARVSIAATVHF